MKHAATLAFSCACLFVLSISISHAAGNIDAGKRASGKCQRCHGLDGNSSVNLFPRLAGQHADYMVKALQDYQSGARKNPIMSTFAASLTKQDILDIAAYFASQPKGLITLYYRK